MNNLTIIGNLVRPVELKFLNNGSAAARLTVAVSRPAYTTKFGKEVAETTSYINVSLIGTIAENAANSLDKGNRVVVTGRMEQRTWDKEDGTKGEIWELSAEAIGPDLRFAVASPQKTAMGKAAQPMPVEMEEAF
jgi:single-strand DNA-binding protein